nr:TIGR01440 family protein [Thermanaeromonas sp. C210]
MKVDFKDITRQVAGVTRELLAVAGIRPGRILVVGCSTSEIAGQKIGTSSSLDIGRAVVEGLLEATAEAQVYLAAQCCEHLNRALVIEAQAAEIYGLEEVTVVPALKAGGALATAAYEALHRPVVVARVQAHAGLDIGGTLIGMHLRPVAVPVRLEVKTIGAATLTMARTRPPLIGGERAVYPPRTRGVLDHLGS